MGNSNYFEELSDIEGLTQLFDIDPDRADLVKNPAITRKFLLIKAKNPDANLGETKENTEETMLELVKKIDGFSQKIQKAELGEKASDLLNRLVDALKGEKIEKDQVSGLLEQIEKAFDGDNISEEQFNDWSGEVEKALPQTEKETEKEAKVEKEVKETKVEKEVEKETEKVEKETEKETEVEKKTPEETPAEQIEKYVAELSAVKKAHAASLLKVQEVQTEVQEMKIEKKRTDLIEKSKQELRYIGKKAEDTADLLMKLYAAGVPQDVFDEVFDCFKTASEMIDKSGFFGERGTSLENDELGDSDAELMKEAQKLVDDEKYDTVEKAYAGILKKNPSRWQDLEEE